MQLVGRCPHCNSNGLVISHNEKMRMGYAVKLDLSCGNCLWSYDFYTSPTSCDKGPPGLNSFCINIQIVLAFPESGKDHETLKMLSSCMNMPQPITAKSFSAVNEKLYCAYDEVTKECLFRAVDEIRHMGCMRYMGKHKTAIKLLMEFYGQNAQKRLMLGEMPSR